MAKTVSAPTFGTINVSLGKTGHSFDIRTGEFSEEIIAFVFAYGLKQIINDAAASGKSDDEKVALANKRLERLYAGELRAQRESDPVRVEMRKVAIALVKRKTNFATDSDEFKAAVAKAMTIEAVRTVAEQNVNRERDLEIPFEV